MNNYQIVVFLAGIVVTVVMLTYAPWVQDHPGIPGPVQQIGLAPVWSHRFDAYLGARMDQVELWTFLLFDWLTSGSSRSGNKETAPIYRRVGGGESTTLHSPSSKRHGRNRSPGSAS